MPAGISDPEVQAALDITRQGALEEPGSAIAWGNYGLTLLAHRFDPEADLCLAEAARLDPDNPLWPYARHPIAQRRSLDKGLPFLRQAAALATSGPDRAAYRLALAEALLELGEAAEAEQIFREEWVADPGQLRAALGLGKLALEHGDEQAAEELLAAAQRSPSARKQATCLLATLARKRRAANADALEKDAAELPLDAGWSDPLDEQTAQRVVGIVTRFGGLPELIGEAHRDPRRHREVAELFLRSARERPTAHLYANAGLNLYRAGDVEAALPLLRKAVGLDPNSPTARDYLAQVLFGRARVEATQSPGSEQARAWFRETVEHARRATELAPSRSRAYLVWGLALMRLGDPAAAVAPLRQGVSCEPGFLELQLALGEALLDSGQAREAAEHLENARRLGPQDPRVAKALERLRDHKD
jgi:tetratricopeptide (TPR) repeat protein